MIGKSLGPYQIVAKLGEGGMGEVYRAHDTRLGREVALKILLEPFARDADRLARFGREAQLLASLSHPNIATIHGVEDADGVCALVLELVEGDTLADRIDGKPLPPAEAVEIARQISCALEAAHERGVIHRDLKPGNVKVAVSASTGALTVKVLDFGLAKALEHAPAASNLSHSPTLTVLGTVAGMILGTAAYMSPEQAKGYTTDARSDVFSFGCVLFEMLTGRQAFQAETATESVAAVLMREPDLGALPSDLHPRLVALVRRCLDKNIKRRWQSMGDVRFELEAITEDPSGRSEARVQGASTTPTMTFWRRALPVAATAIVVGVAASLATWSVVPRPASPVVTRFTIALGGSQQLTRPNLGILAVSPDGSRVVYAADRQLYLRAMADADARPVPGSNVDPANPFFSPDGQWVAFYSFQDSTLKRIPIGGGTPLTLCKVGSLWGASWSADGIVYGSPEGDVMRVSANGGVPQVLAKGGEGANVSRPQVLDRGRLLLFSVARASGAGRWDRAQIVVQSIATGERRVVIDGGSAGQYVPTGHLIYAVANTLLAVPFDLSRLQTDGAAVPIVEEVARNIAATVGNGVAQYDVSPTGLLVYLPGRSIGINVPKTLSIVDREGKAQAIALPPQLYAHPRVSPDGSQLAVNIDDGNEADVWVYDFKAGGALRRLTFGGRNRYPIWTRDGRYLTFQSDRDGDSAIFKQLADGSGPAERLTKPEPGTTHEPESWSPDGKVLSLNVVRLENQGVYIAEVDSQAPPKTFADTRGVEKHSTFSPDGKWLAYMANTGAEQGVFVQPLPPTGAKYQVSSGGTRAPAWSADGKQLFYHSVTLNRLVMVSVGSAPGLQFGTPVTLPIEGSIHPLSQRNYDVTPEGRLIVVLPAPVDAAARREAPRFHVVMNWFEELTRLVPGSSRPRLTN